MQVQEKYHQLETRLKPWMSLMGQAAEAILDQDISNYPIFVASREEIAIGLPLVEREAPEWSINASTLEEFATKSLIKPDKVENFKEIYKDPLKYICLFAVDEKEATFVFLPRT